MRHLGLFEGIGGFSLAARWMDWETKAWVEIDPFCQKVMKKNFPESIGFSDVKTFNYAQYKSVLRNRGERNRQIDIITGGFPCQPFSHAGKRKGNEDERALWYEMYRIIQEVKPLYVVAENVSGLLTIENGLVFERVCLDLENEGYTVQAYIIPACATDAPHRRDRVWIIARNTLRNGWTNNGNQKSATLRQFGNISAGNGKQFYCESDFAYPNSKGLERRQAIDRRKEYECQRSCKTAPTPNTSCQQDKRQIKSSFWVQPTRSSGKWANWYEAATELCRVDDGISEELDKLRNADRAKRLKALGNAIVPQVAYRLFQTIQATEEELFDTPSVPKALTLSP